jgi:NAD(P)-dependent dehydrogenase (short-subunit alcohol dehydrogenase family)
MSLNPRIPDWTGRRVWIVGASTGIGRATAARLHARGARVVVSARGQAALDAFTQAHPGSAAVALDSTDAAAVHAAAQALLADGPLHLVCYCAGYYESQHAADFDLSAMLRHDEVNYRGALNVLAATLPSLVRAGSSGATAHLCLVSSVAGFCGLPQNLAYGPTKAALTHLAEGLYLDLRAKGVGVSVVHPGFVDTPLTAANRFPMPGLTTPQAAAQSIVRGWERGRFEIDFPRRFTLAMKLLRALPYAVFFPAVRRLTRRA